MKLGVFADPHASDLETSCRTRRPSLSYGKMQEAMRAFCEEKVDLVVCLGDLVDHCKDHANDEAELARIGEMLRSYDLPLYCVRGNHDCENFPTEEFFRIGGFRKTPFFEQQGDVLLVFLDACYSSNGEPYMPGKIDWTDSFLPADQLEKLKQVLAGANAKEVVVLMHQQLHPTADPRYLVRNAAQIREVLEQSGKVKQVISGHYHSGAEQTWNGIAYHVIPAMCEREENRYFILDIE